MSVHARLSRRPRAVLRRVRTRRWDGLLAQWDEIKAAVSAAIVDNGGTITHHHAVGRDHRAWYEQQRSDAFGRVLPAAKDTLELAGVMNPGVLAL